MKATCDWIVQWLSSWPTETMIDPQNFCVTHRGEGMPQCAKSHRFTLEEAMDMVKQMKARYPFITFYMRNIETDDILMGDIL